MQTVPAERANELNSFTVVSMPPMIVTAGVNKLQFFEYVSPCDAARTIDVCLWSA